MIDMDIAHNVHVGVLWYQGQYVDVFPSSYFKKKNDFRARAILIIFEKLTSAYFSKMHESEIMLLQLNNTYKKSNTVPKNITQCKLLYYLFSAL